VRRLTPTATRIEGSDMDLKIKVNGMTCQHCVARVKTVIEELPSVRSVVPSLETGDVRIEGDEIDEAGLKAAIESAGYQIET